MSGPLYEVLALRFASRPPRPGAATYSFPDPHDAPSAMDFLLFAIRGEGRTIIVDTGFDAASAARHKRVLKAPPGALLAAAGIAAESAPEVVLTHLHWDHAGGMDAFPRAVFHLQEAEMAFATGRAMTYAPLRRAYDAEDVTGAVRALYSGRLRFHAGDAEIAPGITLHLLGGHSRGIQAVRVPTARGWVVLAGDVAHYWRNLERANPFPGAVDMGAALDGCAALARLADGPDHIIPGHDPLILARFPKLAGSAEIAALHRPPVA